MTFANNEFKSLRRGAIVLHQWNRISIDNNLFDYLENDSIVAGMDNSTSTVPNYEFSFTGNRINKAQPGSLKFAAVSQQVNSARVGNNYFDKKCNCKLESWVQEVTDKNTSTSWMMDSSYCIVDDVLVKCFNVPKGYINMRNFSKIICSENHHIVCEKPSANPLPSPSPPSVGPHVYPRQKGYFNLDMSDPDQLERERRIIIIISAVAMLIVGVMCLVTGTVYMRRRGICPKFSSSRFVNFVSSWFPTSSSGGMTAATSARSISRLSVHEYAGLRPETRILQMEDTQLEQSEDLQEAAEGLYAYAENKATQTLPEELTEEYLTELKDKLNDPDHYSQAREMIEHLYDLIKVIIIGYFQ